MESEKYAVILLIKSWEASDKTGRWISILEVHNYVLYLVKWLIGISCLCKGTLNIHQALLNGVCRHIATSGDLPLLFSHSSGDALVGKQFHGPQHSTVRTFN